MMKISNKALRLLSDYGEWNSDKSDGNEITIFNYLCFNATPDLLFAFASLFFIELISFEGSYFIKERFTKEVFFEWESRLTTHVEIQRVMNHIHVCQLFQHQELQEDVVFESAKLIQKVWNNVFSDLELIAEIHGETVEEVSITLVSAN